MDITKEALLTSLQDVERLSGGGKWARLFSKPQNYVQAVGFHRLVYPLTRKGICKKRITFFGTPMSLMLPAATDIYLTGGKTHPSEIRLSRFIINELNPNDHFLDVGAHYGFFSLLAAQLVGSQGRVIALEASPNNFRILDQNTQAFASNLIALQSPVSDRQHSIPFYEFPLLYSEYNTFHVQQFAETKWFAQYPPIPVMVETTTIDIITNEYKIFPKIIKIDVEGAEYDVLNGAANYLANNSPMIVMEYLAPNRSNEAHQQSAGFLRMLGYQSFSINQSGKLDLCKNIEEYLAKQKQDSDNIVFKKEDANTNGFLTEEEPPNPERVEHE